MMRCCGGFERGALGVLTHRAFQRGGADVGFAWDLRRDDDYGRATVLELKGRTPLTAVAGVSIDWDQVLAKMS